MKLIKLNTDHYVVVDDSEIKEGDCVLSKLNEIVVFGSNYTSSLYKKITHSTQPIEQYYGATDGTIPFVYHKIIELPLSEVKELLGEVDVEKKAEKWHNSINSTYPNIWSLRKKSYKAAFEIAYYQALEDNKAKKYTEEDLRKIFEMGIGLSSFSDTDENKFKYALNHIQPKTEWEVEFIDGKLTLKQ